MCGQSPAIPIRSGAIVETPDFDPYSFRRTSSRLEYLLDMGRFSNPPGVARRGWVDSPGQYR